MSNSTVDSPTTGHDFNKETSFLHVLKSYGIKRLFTSKDFLLSLPLSVIIGPLAFLFLSKNAIRDLSLSYFAIVIPLVGVVVAEMAILASITDNKFIKILSKTRRSTMNIIFTFQYCAFLSIITVLFSLGTFICASTSMPKVVLIFVFFLATFFLLYTLFALFTSLGHLYRLFWLRFFLENRE